GDTVADLVLTFLVMMRVGLLPVGRAWGVLLLVGVVVAGAGADGWGWVGLVSLSMVRASGCSGFLLR
ncbi:hypothetical protein ACFRQM_52150, partial [Streptomyces sp. NPDC056831]|uniref:hypothetical protein n=1 Tax=Streptomyces sp. NPDC056831 TaxID=3345954 RepID=UPI003686B02C